MLNNQYLTELVNKCGATLVGCFDGPPATDLSFRDACAANTCGKYGKCWTCPPDVGNAEQMIASLKEYSHTFVFSVVYPLEDSYDFEGMVCAKKQFVSLSKTLKQALNRTAHAHLFLGAGGCGVCKRCAREDARPCPFPESAIVSLEAYCINVTELSAKAGLKYNNGPNTVTYFGAILF
jgi:predicted metal-binding protein